MLLLIIPDGIISLTSVYGLTTPSFINYDYLNFNFSFLLIPGPATINGTLVALSKRVRFC